MAVNRKRGEVEVQCPREGGKTYILKNNSGAIGRLSDALKEPDLVKLEARMMKPQAWDMLHYLREMSKSGGEEIPTADLEDIMPMDSEYYMMKVGEAIALSNGIDPDLVDEAMEETKKHLAESP